MIFFSFSSVKNHRNRKIQSIHIDVDSKGYWLNKNLLDKILFQKIEKIDKKIGQLCILEMEKKLNNDPFIKKTDVFFSVDGTLHINIFHKKPIF